MLKSLLLVLLSIANTALAQNYFYGLNYGIDQNNCPGYDKIKADFTKIKEYTNRVRTFSLSVCNQGALALQAANELDMNIYLGMWIDRPDTFNNEMNALKGILGSQLSLGKVDGLIVGSEVLYRKDTDENSLANYIDQVGQMVRPKGVKVTTADVYYEFPPVVVDKIDFLMMNAFPYWEGVTADQGATTLLQHYETVVTKANGKPVRITETGWPSNGDNFGASIASPENQRLYLSNVLCQTRNKGIDLIWFSAFDEPYKAGVEAYWGLMNSEQNLKANLTTSLLANPTC
ncbi:glycoside hydrolase superfamily [Gilbertella persicaria]|uniref:glycoside hydrolase superfamily n=1 Tax=Gilbertella persicaria TaxID=101096 RepID=UPI00221F03C8|nr:glycoside hydrolase superfamily [Gilbertella persicaria]KAI8075391.1 glycoside hydrolase superfamily [Gilbertella persicaria]